MVCAVLASVATNHGLAQTVVATTSGQVRSAEQGAAEAFLAAPYAAAPVGALRWREPQSPKPWSGVRARQRIFAYLYDHGYPAVTGNPSWGAFHSSQLPYVFGNIGLGRRAFTAADSRVVRQWQTRLLAFLRTGKPGPGWQPVARSTPTVMGLGDREGLRPAMSTPERFEAFRAYAAAGGKLGLM